MRTLWLAVIAYTAATLLVLSMQGCTSTLSGINQVHNVDSAIQYLNAHPYVESNTIDQDGV